MELNGLKKLLLGSSTTDKEKPVTRAAQETVAQFSPIPNDALIIVPMRGPVLFPRNISPLVIGA